jgi:hypothetical protein
VKLRAWRQSSLPPRYGTRYRCASAPRYQRPGQFGLLISSLRVAAPFTERAEITG